MNESCPLNDMVMHNLFLACILNNMDDIRNMLLVNGDQIFEYTKNSKQIMLECYKHLNFTGFLNSSNENIARIESMGGMGVAVRKLFYDDVNGYHNINILAFTLRFCSSDVFDLLLNACPVKLLYLPMGHQKYTLIEYTMKLDNIDYFNLIISTIKTKQRNVILGNSVFMYASKYHIANVVKLLLQTEKSQKHQESISYYAYGVEGDTALMIALSSPTDIQNTYIQNTYIQNKWETVKLLIKAKSCLSWTNKRGINILTVACYIGNMKILKKLMECGEGGEHSLSRFFIYFVLFDDDLNMTGITLVIKYMHLTNKVTKDINYNVLVPERVRECINSCIKGRRYNYRKNKHLYRMLAYAPKMNVL